MHSANFSKKLKKRGERSRFSRICRFSIHEKVAIENDKCRENLFASSTFLPTKEKSKKKIPTKN